MRAKIFFLNIAVTLRHVPLGDNDEYNDESLDVDHLID